MTTRSLFVVAAIGVAGVAAAIWFGKVRHAPSNPGPDGPLRKLFQSPVLPDFTFAGTDAKRDSTLHTFTNSGSVIRIEVFEHVDATDAETLLQDGVMGIQALYANALSAYPGDISNKLVTDPNFQPRLFHVTNSIARYTYLLLYANDRFGYGATTKDAVKYKSLIGWFYCEAQKQFFKVRLFSPPTTTDHTMETTFTSLRCR